MTELDILLDLLTELVAVLARHSDIGEHEVGFLGSYLLEGGVGIGTGDETIVAREEQTHVVDDLQIVVDDENRRQAL